jgi:peptide/nickel transport system ATP-binding protein
MNELLLRVQKLSVQFTGTRKAQALRNVSFDVAKGEVLTLLGESGSGKSVTLKTLLGLNPKKTTLVSGEALLGGQNTLTLNEHNMRLYRGRVTSMVFQEPGLAFDPVYTIGAQMVEALRAHEPIDHDTALSKALQMLERVQIPQAQKRLSAYPHELSGGMKQRAMIALALICDPQLLLADEPTTALDASVQIQILLLLRELQKERTMSVIFVTHDIGAAVEVSDRIAVMYAGEIVEMGTVHQMIQSPQHPYTQGLLAGAISADQRGQALKTIHGSPPDLSQLPTGCSFAPRCFKASAHCHEMSPPTNNNGQTALACWHPL